MGTRAERRRLDQMVAEARRQEPPPIDVDGVSRHLVARFRVAAAASSAGVARPALARGSLGWRSVPVWAGVLALALLALLLRGVFDDAPDPRQAERRGSSPANAHWIDARGLPVGQPLVAQSRELTIDHAAHARWTLAPGSEAQLSASSGSVVRVVLAKGSLSAEVRASALPESFVVLARGTEVSVHGTRFEVRIEDQGRVAVSVSEGEVRVRPEGGREGVVLSGGMSGRFFAGAPIERVELGAAAGSQGAARAAKESRPGKVARTPAHPSATPSERAAVPPPAATEPGSVAARSGEAEAKARADVDRGAALAKVTERIQQCFARHTERPGELTIEAATRLELEVEPSGSILEVRMNPPLAPVVEECVARQLAALDLGESPQGFQIDDEIRLRR